MIPALTCLLFPFAAGCSAFVRDDPRISEVVARKAFYSGKTLSVTGRVQNLDQWTSRVYGKEEMFSICDNGCIHVYVRSVAPVHDGDLVTVSGQYYAVFQEYRRKYYNELEAARVLLRQ